MSIVVRFYQYGPPSVLKVEDEVHEDIAVLPHVVAQAHQ
ncbi:hypothetical protein Cflav_PD3134 [Pedosphaera parvula Ellin514]|uniref:Uncharacterized protein n=1 Tax=Pedosphaera parvula (strain Ellin514) TaxID=320771 RepID=B9XJ37_PEDPL|nr:hypothetical protein Cflav_PD3134 [Pedosphaera parvula Ellin514]